jgi:hypothetical protein
MVDSAEHYPDYREAGGFPSREKAQEFLALFKQIRRAKLGQCINFGISEISLDGRVKSAI